MPFNPDLSTIQEATFSNSEYFDSASSSPIKSVASEINQNLKKSILSGLNSIRRLQNNPLYEEDSTIIEDESFFDEQDDVRHSCADFTGEQMDHCKPLEQNIRYDEIPLIVEPHINKIMSAKTNPGHQIDEIKVGGNGTYNFEISEPLEQPRNTVQSTKTTVKRQFLKRGQGKNCLQKFPNEQNLKNTMKPKLKPINSKISKISKVPNVKPKSSNHQKSGKENKMPKSSVPKPSKNILNSKTINRVTSNSLYDQEPEDSFNVSIQNEKQANEQLQSKETQEQNEFFMLEKMLEANSKLSLTQFENVLNDSNKSNQSNTSTLSNNSVIENYHKGISIEQNENDRNFYFNPNKYEETDSLIDKNGINENLESPVMKRKTASIQPSRMNLMFDDIAPLATSESSNQSSISNSPRRINAVRELEFSDSTPWKDEDDDINDDMNHVTPEGPSFSTPYRDPYPDSEPSKLMSSIFKNQFDQSKKKENKKVSELENERLELQKLKDEIQKQKDNLKREADRFKRENLSLEKLRQERARELEILKLEKTKTEKENKKRTNELDIWEKEITNKLKEYRKLEHFHRESEKSGMIRRKDFDELKIISAQREKDLKDKFDRVTATNNRLKANNERLQSELSELKEDNRLLTEKMNAVLRDSKRREGNTWREINRIVDKVTEPEIKKEVENLIEQPKKSITKSAPSTSKRSISPDSSLAITMRSSTSISRNSSVFAPGSGADIPAGIIETIQGDNFVTHRYASGKLVTKYDSGTIKEKSADSKTEITRYINGDVQQHLPDGKVVYFYGSNGATSTKFSDGIEILEFPTGQKEINHLDGRKEIQFPDGLKEVTYKNGKRETFYPNGSRKVLQPNGDEIIYFKDGQKEIRTKEYRRRELPDGTTKTIFNDTNLTETRYSSGRIRIKDASGKIIVDRKSENS